MPKITVGSVVIHTYPLPPKGFDPLAATTKELKRYGFPSRPDIMKSPHEAAKWITAFRRYGEFEHITPTFKALEHRHAPNLRTDINSRGHVNATSKNWSGSVLFIGGSNQAFIFITGTWTVPHAYPIPGTFKEIAYSSPGMLKEKAYSSAWLGIDGDGSPDVMQAGTESDSDGTCYAWFEWYPMYSVAISNFTVNPGDVITLFLCVLSSTQANVGMSNLSTKRSTNFSFSAPSGTNLVGNCAEAIVERPTINGELAKLPRYGEVFFDDTYACGSDSVSYRIGLGTAVSMKDDNGVVISMPSFEERSDDFIIKYIGP
jgi:hypothetical protein